MLNPCRLCPARCCHTTVKATLPDAFRYCATLCVPFFSAFTFQQSTDPTRGIALDRDERIIDPDDGWPGYGELRLRRTDSGACAQLIDLGGYLRCGAYAVRPMNCRLYPVSWEDEDGRGGPNAVLCPVPYGVTPKEAARVEADGRRLRADWAIHERVVGAWNQSEPEDRSLERALRFLLEMVAEHLETPFSEEILSEGTPEERLTDAMVERRIIPSPPFRKRESRVFAGLPVTGRPL